MCNMAMYKVELCTFAEIVGELLNADIEFNVEMHLSAIVMCIIRSSRMPRYVKIHIMYMYII
jgi:hypothetical protein